jgi:hypothetical protein
MSYKFNLKKGDLYKCYSNGSHHILEGTTVEILEDTSTNYGYHLVSTRLILPEEGLKTHLINLFSISRFFKSHYQHTFGFEPIEDSEEEVI